MGSQMQIWNLATEVLNVWRTFPFGSVQGQFDVHYAKFQKMQRSNYVS